ncbi:hypothetical protein PROFUN_04174 [Planoprotostelium fungivorum]|uniref:Transmembrane protein n=1 Tax=Planoprotostelium fungivorum TaxID=1890364 RepID=A0A2P6NVU2_9EUKA|nr:hypothetical protein PROFUN_04174 [Planoprotostelium fungivorum]
MFVSFFHEYTSIQMILLTSVVFLTTALPLSMIQASVHDISGLELLDARWDWSEEDAMQLFKASGERGRDLYAQALKFYGVMFLFSYFLWGSFTLFYFLQKSEWRKVSLYAPLLMVTSDLLEDYCILALLTHYESNILTATQTHWIAKVGSTATLVKWFSIYFNIAILTLAALRFGWAYLTKKGSAGPSGKVKTELQKKAKQTKKQQ